MRYMGSKRRIVKQIRDAILERVPVENREWYVEPFVGGMNSFQVIAPEFRQSVAADVSVDLMEMWRAVLCKGWEPPKVVSVEDYNAARHAESSAHRGFIGFGCSFGGKWFGGYARGGKNADGTPRAHAAESARNVLRTREALRDYGGFDLWCCDYRECVERFVDVPTLGNVTFYCDPPYAGTVGYGSEFDSGKFWEVMQNIAELGAHVFVSEYSAPDGWVPIWESALRVTVGRCGRYRHTSHEKLWVFAG